MQWKVIRPHAGINRSLTSNAPEQNAQQAGAIFANQRARAVLPEGCNQDREDQNAVATAALNELEDQLRTKQENERILETYEVRTSNMLVDQFQPLYFATALESSAFFEQLTELLGVLASILLLFGIVFLLAFLASRLFLLLLALPILAGVAVSWPSSCASRHGGRRCRCRS